MHDLIRAYATTAHDLPEDVREAALVRVVDFHLHTAHAANRLLDPTRRLPEPDPPAPGVHLLPLPDAMTATAWMEAEHAILLATQRAAAALSRHRVVWHLARTLDRFHYRRGHLRDELATWRAALAAAAHLSDPAALSCAHRLLGTACATLGLRQEATGHLDQALSLALRHHDIDEQANTQQMLAYAWGLWGDDRRALSHAEHALDLFRVLGQPVQEATALNQVGWYGALLGDFDTAREHCQAALALHRDHHDPGGEADTLDSLGLIAHRTGDHRQAIGHYEEALTLFRLLGNTYLIADTLENIGHPRAALGHHDQARKAWQEALELYRELNRDDDAERVRRRLGELGPASMSNTPSDARDTTRNARAETRISAD